MYPYRHTHSATQPTTPLSPTSELNISTSHVSSLQQQSDPAGVASSSSSSVSTSLHLGSSGAGQFPSDFHTFPSQEMAPVGSQTSLEGQYVLHYFEHVRRLQYIFAGNSVTNVTYSVRLRCNTRPILTCRTRFAENIMADDCAGAGWRRLACRLCTGEPAHPTDAGCSRS